MESVPATTIEGLRLDPTMGGQTKTTDCRTIAAAMSAIVDSIVGIIIIFAVVVAGAG